MTEYNEGDLVEAVKGKRRVIDQVVIPPKGRLFQDGPYLGAPSLFGPSSIASYKDAGYVVTVVERATPPLPTEPGSYALQFLNGDHVYTLADDGTWWDGCDAITSENLARRATVPFIRLEPVPVTAKRVLDLVRERYLSESPNVFVTTILYELALDFGADK